MNRIFLLLCTVLVAQAASGPIRLTAEIPWDDQEGYTPVIVTLRSAVDAVVDIAVERGGESGATARFSLQAGAPAETHTILVPSHQRDRMNFTLRMSSDIGHAEQRHLGPLINRYSSSASGGPIAYIGDSTRLRAELENQGFSDLEIVPTRLLPQRWQGHAYRQPLLIGPESRDRIDAGQALALQRFAALGGPVWVIGSEPWSDLPGVPQLDPADESQRTEALRRMEQLRDRSWPVRSERVAALGSGGPMLFMLLSVLFFVIAGPLNLLWAHRRRELHLLFVSTPLISGVACLALIVAGLLSEGISSSRDVVSLSDLDQSGQQAINWHGISYYAPFAPGSFAIDDEARALVMDDDTFERNRYRYGSDQSAAGCAIDWRQGQLLNGRWITARRHRQLAFTRPGSERRRLLLEPGPGGQGWRLTNGLGVELRLLRWRDDAGQLWALTGLAPGASAPLQLLNDQPNLLVPIEPPLERLEPPARERWRQRQQEPLAFVARLGAALDPPPGPTADDHEPPEAYCCGSLAPSGEEDT